MLGDMLRGGLAVTEDHAEADVIVRDPLAAAVFLMEHMVCSPSRSSPSSCWLAAGHQHMCLRGGSEDREHRCELLAEVYLMTTVQQDWAEPDACTYPVCIAQRPPLALQAILEAAQQKAQGSNQKIVVTGCLAQRYSAELAGKHSHGAAAAGRCTCSSSQ